MARKRHTSVSQLQKFMRCPRSWYYRYKQKLPEPASVYLIRGSLVHLVSETFTRTITPKTGGFNKNNFKVKIPEVFETLFTEALMAPGEFYGKPTKSPYVQYMELYENDETKVNEAISDAKAMLKNYIDKLMINIDMMLLQSGDFSKSFKTCMPIKQEMEIKVDDLTGFIDQIFEIGDKIVICDLKTSKMKSGKQAGLSGYVPLGLTGIDPEYEFQLLIYLYAYWKMTGKVADYLALNYLAYGNEIVIPTKWINTDELFPEIETLINTFMQITESNDIEDYPMNCDGSVKLLPGFELENLFCSAKTARFAGRGFCPFDRYCDECIGEGEWTDVEVEYTVQLDDYSFKCTSWIAEQKGFKKSNYQGSLIRETEKAICIRIPDLSDNIWMPKSQITKIEE